MELKKAVEFDWVDAFSGTAFRGNGCAVVYQAEDWTLDERLAFVRETSLSECTFVSLDGDNWRVQYYLPNREIPYAGHPTIATAWSLFQRRLISDAASLQTGMGAIAVEMNDGWVTINAPIPQFGAEFEKSEIADIYGLCAKDILIAPQMVEAGLSFVMTVLASQSVTDKAEINAEKLEYFRKRHGLPDFCEPYLVTFEHKFQDEALTLARLLLPPPLPKEDPFTGSASGMFAAWAFSKSLVPNAFTHAQGHALDRLGFAKLSLQGAPNSIESIKLSGQAHCLMSGHITK